MKKIKIIQTFTKATNRGDSQHSHQFVDWHYFIGKLCVPDIKKLKAFTILELSVVMAISGIVFAISYSAYTIVNKQYTEFKKESEKIIDVSTIYVVLTKDFSEAREIRKGGNELLLTKTDGNEIVYTFESDALIRKVNDVVDRFENISDSKISFIGAEQTESNGLVDELYCEIGKEAFPLHIKKYYAADVLMALEERNQ